MSHDRLIRVQVTLGIMLALCLVGAAIGLFMSTDKYDYSGIEAVSKAELVSRVNSMHNELNAGVGESPVQYFKTVDKVYQLEHVVQRFTNDHPGVSMFDLFGYEPTMAFSSNLQDLQIDYDTRFSHGEMLKAADAPGHSNVALDMIPQDPAAWARSLVVIGWCAFVSYFIALAFLVTRLRTTDRKVWPEVAMLRIFVAAALWPIALWRYPALVNPATQARRAIQIVTGLFAGTLSVASISPAYASERKGEETEEANTASTVAPFNGSLTTGIMSQKVTDGGVRVHEGAVAFIDANVSYKGFTLDYWASRSFDGSTASDENDYTLSWTGTRPNGSLTVGLAYYDIQPIGSEKGGDILGPFAAVSRKLSQDVSLNAKFQGYVMTSGPASRGGYDVTVGVSWTPPVKPLQVSGSASLTYADPPFGADEGILARVDLSASVPVTARFRAFVAAKLMAPLAGIRDRSPTATGKVGLAYAF